MPDSSFAARHVSTTSSTVLTAASAVPTFWPGRAEPAVVRRRVVPERADRVDVDAEIGALHHADALHRHVARCLARVPCRLRRQPDRIDAPSRVVHDRVAASGLPSSRYGDGLPNASATGTFIQISRLAKQRRNRDLEAGSQSGAGPRDAARAVERHVRRHAKPAAEQIDLELAGVERHRVLRLVRNWNTVGCRPRSCT